MTTRKIFLELVTTPATGVVSEAPKAIEIPEHLQNQLLFHQQVAKRSGPDRNARGKQKAAL